MSRLAAPKAPQAKPSTVVKQPEVKPVAKKADAGPTKQQTNQRSNEQGRQSTADTKKPASQVKQPPSVSQKVTRSDIIDFAKPKSSEAGKSHPSSAARPETRSTLPDDQ